jgi:Glycoside hydrolase 123, catalytic domain/Glycoside hydrolase 123 N-terminal domain
MITRLLLAACLVAAASFSPAPAAADSATSVPAVVLDTAGVWRMYHTLKPPAIQQSDGGMKPLLFNVKWLDWETPPPPADWTKPEASDRTWMRGPARRCARTPYLARLSMRGKFEVTDPSAVSDFSLALEYYGGVVVYLNGKEFGRGNLASGTGASGALAEPYPIEAFLDAKGNLRGASRRGPPANLGTRSLNLSVPKGLLRKGINVLAIDIVRAPYPEALLTKRPYMVGGGSKDPGLLWNTCEIRTIRLSASSPDGVVPNTTRPEGIQVWNADTLAGDVDVDYGDRTESLNPIVISSPRNGTVYGKVIIGSDKPVKNLKVIASDLKSGTSVIPSSQVSFLYGTPGGTEALPRDKIPAYPRGTSFLNALLAEPLSEFPVVVRSTRGNLVNGAVVPLWVRVKVPRDSRPGTYKGTLTVTTTDGSPVKVPLDLTVLPWTMPAPQDFRTWVELIQSPDTLAVEYNVPLWSDEHFALIARSFELVSDTGARSLYIPAIAHTNLGNEQSMIRWIKKADGKYDWDFSVMDRYLDTAQKHLGTPKLVVLQVWEVYMNTKDSAGKRFGSRLAENQKNTGGAPLVTFIDAAKNTENGTIPKLNDPASKPIWQELLTKVRERLKKRGLEKTLQIGMFTDSVPNKHDTEFFLDIAPDLAWVQMGHNAFRDLRGIAKVGYTATWWSGRFADDLVNRRSGAVGKSTRGLPSVMTSLLGWNRPRLDAYYPRMSNERHPISYWRFLCETAITGDFFGGIGRVGADYWPAIKNGRGRRVGWVSERFPEVGGYLHSLHSYVLEPQAAGPVAMTRLVALEEGIQECEARIYIEDALVNKGLAKRAPELAKRCQETLDERLLYMWKGLDNMRFGGWGITAWRYQAGVSGHAWLLNTARQDRTEKLYALAGEVEKVIGKN